MHYRRAFTVVELLVSIAIVGLLLSIAVVAVQRSRGTARRLQCANNLKQIGVAIENCVESSGHYPTQQGNDAWDAIYQALGFPLKAKFSAPMWFPSFICPQDDYSGDTTKCSRSYAMNAGTHFRLGDKYRNGYLTDLTKRYPSHIADGLTQTAFFSERLIVSGSASDADVLAEPRRYLWWTASEVPRTPGNEPAFIAECESHRTSQLPYRYWGPDSGGHGYDHHLPPNRSGCWNGPSPDAYLDDAIAPASSNHSGGVNVLFGDGHVTTVSDLVDAGIWRALGSINGGESVERF